MDDKRIRVFKFALVAHLRKAIELFDRIQLKIRRALKNPGEQFDLNSNNYYLVVHPNDRLLVQLMDFVGVNDELKELFSEVLAFDSYEGAEECVTLFNKRSSEQNISSDSIIACEVGSLSFWVVSIEDEQKRLIFNFKNFVENQPDLEELLVKEK